jgi:flagellar biosynthesis protein FliQ
LETLFASTISDKLSLGATVNIIVTSLIMGLFISIIYIKTQGKESFSHGFTITLIMLPAIIAIIILLVGNNIARAFSLAGAFSLIRFRSTPGDPIDVAYVFFTLAVGLACGMGYIAYGILFAIILCLVMVILSITKYAKPKVPTMQLKITIPEDVDFQNCFDDILEEYTQTYKVQRVKTTDFGSLFEIAYVIQPKDDMNQKAFIDELRCRNGNLSIVLNTKVNEDKVYLG